MKAAPSATGDASSVSIRFDPDQQFQIDAVDAAVDLFRGQRSAPTWRELPPPSGRARGLLAEQSKANDISVTDEQIAGNLAEIQDRNDIPGHLRGPVEDGQLASRDFTVEMETGTGKTYVYLRTIFELNQAYGWDRFIIVVPSIAIREGVQASFRLLHDHFETLFSGLTYDVFTYDSKVPSQARSFAQTDYLQIMIVNIDAINKPESNRIYQLQEMGHAPIDFIRATNPILILDEPQNMESERAKAALAALNPLFALRYSATHLDAYHQIYRLTPADAYNLGLVKQIEVWSVLEEESISTPHVRLVSVSRTGRTIKAKVELDLATAEGVKRKSVTVAADADLAEVTGRELYAGYEVDAIFKDRIEFTNGVALNVGESHGADRDQVQRVQLRTAIRQHLDQEMRLASMAENGEIAPTKALALIFIENVDDYWPEGSRLKRWFTEEYEAARKLPKYSRLDLPEASKAHGGYFARDRSGVAKNSKGKSEADREAYELIMRHKERLLSLEEPLRFIFSHSALREGWDNPNVFTIATLAESRSELKKRQEIGRGLRLPVMSDGHRCRSREVAVLKVIANESYSEFAAQLQKEIEEDTGSKFEPRSVREGPKRRPVELRGEVLESQRFLEMWEHISPRTEFHIRYDDDRLLQEAAKRLRQQPSLDPVMIRTVGARIGIDESDGVEADLLGELAPVVLDTRYPVGDIISQVASECQISRAATAQIIGGSGRISEASTNPQQFLDQVKRAVAGAIGELLSEGIEYRRRPGGECYEATLFSQREMTTYEQNAVPVDKSVYAEVVADSDLEVRIAEMLNKREDVILFLKLPGWFTVDTPIGTYNPDWAYMKQVGDDARLCLVRESKANRDLSKLREEERLKVLFGGLHFKELGVDFGVIDDPGQV